MKKIFAFVLTLLVLLLGALLLFKQGTERILLLQWSGEQQPAQLLSMEINSKNLKILGTATGTIDWLQSEKGVFAVRCVDKTSICIYHLSALPNNFILKGFVSNHFELAIPSACLQSLSELGVNSLSWSKDGKQIAVICENGERSNLCLLELSGSSRCWEERSSNERIIRVDWSPTSDILVVDSAEQSYILPADDYDLTKKIKVIRQGSLKIVDTDGKVLKSLVDGWSPAWSPDGKEIAFFRWDEVTGYPGIAVIKPTGDDLQWIYLPPARGSGGEDEYYHPIFRGSVDCMGSSKIVWSPDGRFLLVEASVADFCRSTIFQIEVKTGKITQLISNTGNYREVDIGP